MRTLLLGGGGREHALACALAKSPRVSELIAAPGNPGIETCARTVALDPTDPEAVVAFCGVLGVDWVVIGPEAPLAAGVADVVRAAGVACFGPSAAAARLETSKSFTKEIARAVGAPTAAAERFDDLAAARVHLGRVGAPIVVKADGLAAGKGVTVAETEAEADAALAAIFAEPGAVALLEEKMTGREASLFVLTDGETARVFGAAEDHKRAFDGDRGPNTGGMGAFSPSPTMTPEVEARAMDEIVRPCLAEMARRGAPYRGVLYAGLMIENGAPRLVEFNARFGDPETQALVRLLRSDLAPALRACDAPGQGLATVDLAFSEDAAVCVTVAAQGYPGGYATGEEIKNLAAAGALPGVEIFHAGTASAADGAIRSNGGRVLSVTAVGSDLEEARRRADAALAAIDWPGGFFRTDIGAKAL